MGAAEVLARAARQHGDLGVRPGDGVGDLVHGAVAADHDEKRVLCRPGSLREVPRKLRQHLLALQTELGGALPELRPALSGRAVTGSRIDEVQVSRYAKVEEGAMSETLAPEKVEVVVITGPDRGRIIEIPAPETDQISETELRLLNQALESTFIYVAVFERRYDGGVSSSKHV